MNPAPDHWGGGWLSYVHASCDDSDASTLLRHRYQQLAPLLRIDVGQPAEAEYITIKGITGFGSATTAATNLLTGAGAGATQIYVASNAGLGVTLPPTWVQIGDGSSSEYRSIVTPGAAARLPLSFAYSSMSGVSIDHITTLTPSAGRQQSSWQASRFNRSRQQRQRRFRRHHSARHGGWKYPRLHLSRFWTSTSSRSRRPASPRCPCRPPPLPGLAAPRPLAIGDLPPVSAKSRSLRCRRPRS